MSRVPFDQGTPAPLGRLPTNHSVETAHERGWSTLENGQLLASAEEEGFDVFVTADSNLKYQQSLESRSIAIVVLSTTSWPRIREAGERVVRAVDGASANAYIEVNIPWPERS